MSRRTMARAFRWWLLSVAFSISTASIAAAQYYSFSCNNESDCATTLREIAMLTDFTELSVNSPTRFQKNLQTLLKYFVNERPIAFISLMVTSEGTFAGSARTDARNRSATITFNEESGEVIESDISPEFEVTTRFLYNQYEFRASGPVILVLEEPRGLRRTADIGCRVDPIGGLMSVYQMSWNASFAATSYEVYATTAFGGWELEGTTSDLGGYILTNFPCEFAVRACNAVGCSNLSAERVAVDNSLCSPWITNASAKPGSTPAAGAGASYFQGTL